MTRLRTLGLLVVGFTALSLQGGVGAQAPTPSLQCTIPAGSLTAGATITLSQDSQVSVEFCGGSAGYTSDLYLSNPDFQYIATGNVTPSGTVVDLGVQLEGNELVFMIYVRDTGFTFYSGSASRNADGRIHAGVANLGGGVYQVGFEDLFGGGDGDMDDITFVVRLTPADQDDDGIADGNDNCPLVANENQLDTDGDGLGDACDSDDDNDSVPDDVDNCPLTANADQDDDDADGIGNVCDSDDDGDGVNDGTDECPDTPAGSIVNANGCSIADLCPCESTWKNHGAYVSCVARQANEFASRSLISETDKSSLVTQAAESTCGK
jgi:hypothetical protein